MVTDPIADVLIRIKNGYLARKEVVTVPHSILKESVMSVLERTGYIGKSEVKKQKSKGGKTITITLKYKDGKPAMANVKRISKPGVRIYVDKYHIPTVMTGYGMAILSTSKGVVTDSEARKQKIGGEVLCHIW